MENTFIGSGAIIRQGIRIAENNLIGAGSVIIRDTQPDSTYIGKPGYKHEKRI